jgi:hypothetical protein
MYRVFIKCTIRDYEEFRDYFDSGDEERKTWGIRGSIIHRTVGTPNEVTVVHDFDTVEDAKAFTRRDRLRDAMAIAGATHAPLMWVTERM